MFSKAMAELKWVKWIDGTLLPYWQIVNDKWQLVEVVIRTVAARRKGSIEIASSG